MTLDVQELAFSLYGIQKVPYTKFPRTKRRKDGSRKIRWISAPDAVLKKIQQVILTNVLYRFAAHSCAYAYVARKNIRGGAYLHKDSEYMIVLDIKQFFPTITKEMVKKTFLYFEKDDKQAKNKGCRIESWDSVSQEALVRPGVGDKFPLDFTILDLFVEFCTFEGCLPQGAPTSGAISNIVMYPLDCLFEQVAETHNLIYTRYADDLTFSGNDLDNLKKMVFGYVFAKIREHGFTINNSKVHVFRGDHKLVTGLNVHKEGVRPCRKYRREFRARMANLRKRILAESKAESLLETLKKTHFLRSELGHVWYAQYCDTYSEAPEKVISDYFLPIADHIASFYPGFSTENCVETLPSVLGNMHCEIRKMRMSIYPVGTSRTHRTPLRKVFGLTAITYKSRRNLITQAIEEGTCDTSSCSLRSFKALYRFASPEDRIKILILATQDSVRVLSVLQLICEFGIAHPYKDRLALLRALVVARDKASALGSLRIGSSNSLKMSICYRKILRGLALSDLAEFVTSEHIEIRNAAMELINYRKVRKSTISDPLVIPNEI
jgi:hypothetical protein